MIVCLRREGELLDEFAKEVEVEGLAVPSIRHPLFLPRMAGLLPAIRRRRPLIVHTYLFPSNVFGPVAARLAGAPAVITSRRGMSDIEPARQHLAYRLTDPLVDRIVAVSGAVAASWAKVERLPLDRFTVIENGMDTTPYDGPRDPSLKRDLFGIPPGDTLVGLVSNFRPTKGQEHFIEMALRLAPSHPRVRFMIVGEGPGRSEAEKRVREGGLADRFVFAGLRDDIPAVLRCLDVFAYPSYSEGISNALMEAMAAGCPVVAARCPGNELLVGTAGRLVPPADPVALAREVATLVAEPATARALGAAARRRLRSEFSIARMTAGFERLYLECLAARGLAAAPTDGGGATIASATRRQGGSAR